MHTYPKRKQPKCVLKMGKPEVHQCNDTDKVGSGPLLVNDDDDDVIQLEHHHVFDKKGKNSNTHFYYLNPRLLIYSAKIK